MYVTFAIMGERDHLIYHLSFEGLCMIPLLPATMENAAEFKERRMRW